MGHSDLLKYSLGNISHRKLRSWLTILGVVVGIGAIVALISIAQGLDAYINDQLALFGSDWLQVNAGSPKENSGFAPSFLSQRAELTTKDVDALSGIGGASGVSYSLGDRANVEFRGVNGTTIIAAVEPFMFEEFYTQIKTEDGRVLKDGDRGVIVIGYKLAHEFFDDEVQVGDSISVEGKDFQVIGIFEEMGGGMMSMLDNSAYLMVEDGRQVLGHFKDNDKVTEIYVKAEPGTDINSIAQDATYRLADERGVPPDDPDFTVYTPEKISQQVSAITGALSLFLGGIAAISLIVGGIGIANSLFTSVLERTREIGILKAIGASSWTILEIFLFEAGIIGLAGGTIGASLGMLVCLAMNSFGVPSRVSPELFLFAVSFSVTIGLVSGYFPAASASKLNPVEALRYE